MFGKIRVSDEVFILTTIPPDGPGAGGMEQFIRYLAAGLGERGYKVKIFHQGNSVPPWWRQPWLGGKLAGVLAALMRGYFIGRAVKRALHPGVRLVLSNSTVGWYPLGDGVRQAHFHHGTYRGQAEAIRPFITYKGYLGLKWYSSMVLERFSGRGKIVLCCSEVVREEVRRFFKQRGHVMYLPIDLGHWCPRDRGNCRREIGLGGNQSIGLFVGSTHPMKGFSTIEYLIRAFPHVRWLLALRDTLPESIGKLLQVTLFQNAGYELLPILYNSADFCVCPSRYDPFPYVVSEALACGTPVIASPHGASVTYHKGNQLERLLTESTDDYRGFEESVRLVLDEPQKWRQIVCEQVRPRVATLMAPENWWQRFLSVSGLENGDGL
jgi:glycosyltransferase involved in cell wall biosynthesis